MKHADAAEPWWDFFPKPYTLNPELRMMPQAGQVKPRSIQTSKKTGVRVQDF